MPTKKTKQNKKSLRKSIKKQVEREYRLHTKTTKWKRYGRVKVTRRSNGRLVAWHKIRKYKRKHPFKRKIESAIALELARRERIRGMGKHRYRFGQPHIKITGTSHGTQVTHDKKFQYGREAYQWVRRELDSGFWDQKHPKIESI